MAEEEAGPVEGEETPAAGWVLECAQPFAVISGKGATNLKVCTLKTPAGEKVGRGMVVNNRLRSLAGVRGSKEQKTEIAGLMGKSLKQIQTEAPLNF